MSYGAKTWRQFKKSRSAVIGLVVVAFLLFVALFANRVAPYDPLKVNYDKLMHPPSREHIMGTDWIGRDVLSRMIAGSRLSLSVGFISVGIGLVCGTILGLAAAFYRKLDNVIMRFIDILMAFPSTLLCIAVVAMLGPSLQNAMIAVGVTGIPGYTRMVRGTALSVRSTDYVEAARAIGVRDLRIMIRHMFPNMLAPLLVMITFGLASAVLSAAGLSFLGLGAQPPEPEWGLMISEGRHYMLKAPWLVLGPGIIVTILILGVNLLGDGMRDALDPRLH
jgi:ABC-type dipeptide/oligopeptide/nickel transport system permease subunit